MTRQRSTLCLKVGSEAAPPGAIFRLAVRLADHAKAEGMRLVSIRRSKSPASVSCMILLEDSLGHRWLVRVSDHPAPALHAFNQPHFDFVSVDGSSGFSSACGTITAIADGTLPWWETEKAHLPPIADARKHRS